MCFCTSCIDASGIDLKFMFFRCRLCETVVPLEDPIITETTSTLQEWGVLWKQLYVVSSGILQYILLISKQTTKQ